MKPFQKSNLSITAACSISFTVLIMGCGGPKEPELAPVIGVVKINGQAAPDIMVQFLPVVKEGDPAPTSSGITDDKGQFEMATDSGKSGAVVGKCKVLFIDMNEERVPQGQEATRPSRISSELMMISPRTREVDVEPENKSFTFDI